MTSNANGAGIAADPTLTDAWPSSFNTSVQGTQTWHPMFPPPAIRKWSSGSFTGARTGIRIYPPLGPVSAACDPRIARLPCPAALQRAVPQPGLPLVDGAWNDHIAFRSEDLCAAASSATDRDGPARNEKPSPFRHRPALRPAKGLGTRVSKSAWTEPAASSRFRKALAFQIVRSSW